MGSFLMDTNAGIDLLDGRLPQNAAIWLDNQLSAGNVVISVINKIELLGFNAPSTVTLALESLVNNVDVLALSDNVVNQTIALKKIKRIKLPDAIIAATALVHNLTIISRNTSDFKNISGLTCLDPYTDI
jgi:toxin FitB